MSYYKKAIVNEYVIDETDGFKAIAKPTVEDLFEINVIFKELTTKKDLDLEKVRALLNKVLWQGIHKWKDNKPTDEKVEGMEDVTKDDINYAVSKNIIVLWANLLEQSGIFDTKVVQQMKDEYKKETKN